MPGFREAITSAARELLCLAIDDLANANALFADLTAPFPPAARFQQIAAILRTICDDEPPPPPEPEINGGQCPAAYEVFFTVQPVNGVWSPGSTPPGGNTAAVSFDRRLRGPITKVGTYLAFTSPGSGGVAEKGWGLEFISRGDLTDNPGAGQSPTPVTSRTAPLFTTLGNDSALKTTITNLVRLDGLPDNCGTSPIPDIPPPAPGWNQTTTNVTYQNRDGLDITVPVGFFFANAFFDANFDVQIPIYLTLDNAFSFPINFNVSTGGFTFNFGPVQNGPGGTPPPQPPPPPGGIPGPTDFNFDVLPPPPPSGDEFEDTEEPDDPKTERVIRAVLVTLTGINETQVGLLVQDGGNPDIRIPGLGFVQFKVRIGAVTGWTNDIPVKNDRAFIPCPWEGGAIDVRGSPRPGVNFALTPVYLRTNVLS